MTVRLRAWATLLDIGAMQRTRHLDAPAHYDAIAYIFIKLIARWRCRRRIPVFLARVSD